MKALLSLAVVVFAAASASADPSGNYTLVSGNPSCAPAVRLDIDPSRETVALSVGAIGAFFGSYSAQKVCHESHSQLNSPEDCEMAAFSNSQAGSEIELTETYTEHLFGIPTSTSTQKAVLQFDTAGQSMLVHMTSDAQYGSKGECSYERGR